MMILSIIGKKLVRIQAMSCYCQTPNELNLIQKMGWIVFMIESRIFGVIEISVMARRIFGVVKEIFEVARRIFGVVKEIFEVARRIFGVVKEIFELARGIFGVVKEIFEVVAEEEIFKTIMQLIEIVLKIEVQGMDSNSEREEILEAEVDLIIKVIEIIREISQEGVLVVTMQISISHVKPLVVEYFELGKRIEIYSHKSIAFIFSIHRFH